MDALQRAIALAGSEAELAYMRGVVPIAVTNSKRRGVPPAIRDRERCCEVPSRASSYGRPCSAGGTCQEARDTPGAGIGQGRPGHAGGEAHAPTEVGGGHEEGGIARASARRSVAVHDGWAPYRKYDCTHALCKAHPLREPIFQAETRHAPFAPSLIDLLCEANTEAARSAQRRIRQERQRHYRERYDPIVDHAQRLPPAQPSTGQRGRAKQSDTVDLLRRLHDPAEEALRFLADPRVPFDNNEAERDIRIPKLKQKISGAFRTPEGAATFCSMRSYLATLRKQSRDLFESLVLTFKGEPPEPTFSG